MSAGGSLASSGRRSSGASCSCRSATSTATPRPRCSRGSPYTEQIGQAATDSVIIVVRTTLTILGSSAFLLWLNVRLTLVALTMGPLVAWLVSVINRRFRRYGRRIQDSMGDITRVAKESFEAPRLI